MYRVTDAQIDYILNDIKQRGVELEDLQQNLLDHVCCMLEQNCKNESDFETEYNKTINQFFKHELWEIEEETILLLKYKHYYKMKRFLYILLFLSVSYNIYVFSRLGYEFYKQREWKVIEKSTLQDGFLDFKKKLYKQNPNIPKKQFIYVSYVGDAWLPLRGDFDGYSSMDTAEIRQSKQRHMQSLKVIDSIANIYKQNIIYVHAYQEQTSSIDPILENNKKHSANIIFIKNVPMLLQGYENSKNQWGTFAPTTFVLDSTGKIIFESSSGLTNFPDKKLITFLKSIE